MFKSRELSNLQNRVADLEKQIKAANGKNAGLEKQLKAASAKVQRYSAALDDLNTAIAAKAEEDEEDEPTAEGDEEEEPSGKKSKRAEGEDPDGDEDEDPAADEDEPSAEGEDEEPADDDDKTMRKSKASLALLNRLPGKAQVAKQVEKKAAKVVTSRLAAAGVDPVKRDKTIRENNSISRAEFAKLSPSAQSSHFRNGGKVTE